MTTLSVLDAAREAPGQIALTDGTWAWNYAELAERVRARLLLLDPIAQQQGRAPQLVALVTDESPAAIETLLSLIELSIPFFPIHERATPEERRAMLAALPVSWIIQPSGADGLELAPHTPRESAHARDLLSRAPQLAALATSGSSGAPRVALLGRSAFLAAAAASAAHLGWQPGDRWLLCLPLGHIGGLSVVTRCLLARRTVVLLPERAEQSSTQRLATAIDRGAPTLISMVPAQLAGLLELEPRFDLPSRVRGILTGGAAASPRLLAACAARGWPVLTSYGLTEACSQVATQRPGTPYAPDRGVGVPLPGITVRVDEGVIHILGPTLSSGYLGADTEEVIDPRVGFRTRDLGRIDAEGELHVLGRVDDIIISGGENVAPFEVEAVLEGCSGVLEACVFGVPHPRWGEVVAAGLRTRVEDAASLIASVESEARQRLAPFRRPRHYVCVRQFILGKNGKLDRRETARALRAEIERSSEEPVSG